MTADYHKNYVAAHSSRKPFFEIWSVMIWELINSRELIWRLFIRDFTAKYKQALLGIAWAVIMPAVVIGTFLFLNKSGILNIGQTTAPYPLFALTGLSIWQLFSTGLNSSSNSLVAGGSMISKINFAKESLIISSFAQSVFEFIIRLVLIFIVLIIYKVTPHWKMLLFPFLLVPLIFLTIGLGFLTSLLTALMRDMQNIISLLLSLLLFITPVLYTTRNDGLLSELNAYNPLVSLINFPRDLLLNGSTGELDKYLYSSAASMLLFFIAWRVFHLVEPRMTERI